MMFLYVFSTILVVVLFIRNKDAPVEPSEIEDAGGRWVRMPDGRLLEYFVCGDPMGTPVYYQHAFGMTGRAIYNGETCLIADTLKLRLISPSMPGAGLSSHYPTGVKRNWTEWPEEVKLVLDQEDVDRFYVSGHSLGGTHGFVVAHAFPDRVLGIGLFSPLTSYGIEDTVMELPPQMKLLRMLMEFRFSGDIVAYCASHVSAKTRMSLLPDVNAAMKRMESNTPPMFWHADALEGFVKDCDRNMLKGYRGWSDNVYVWNEDPPLTSEPFHKIVQAGKSIVITSSEDDWLNPPIMLEWWAKAIPGVRIMHRADGYGHLHAFDPECIENVFRAMKGEKGEELFTTPPPSIEKAEAQKQNGSDAEAEEERLDL